MPKLQDLRIRTHTLSSALKQKEQLAKPICAITEDSACYVENTSLRELFITCCKMEVVLNFFFLGKKPSFTLYIH